LTPGVITLFTAYTGYGAISISCADQTISLGGLKINSFDFYEEAVYWNITYYNSTNLQKFYHVSDGQYTHNITARDVGGLATTISRNVVVDTTAPIVNWTGTTLANGTIVVGTALPFGVTATEVNLANITVRLYNNAGALVSSQNSTSAFSGTFTSLAAGWYTLEATAYDLAGWSNVTDNRTIKMFGSAVLTSTFNSSVVETTTQGFSMTGIWDNVAYSNAVATLYYGGVAQTTASSISGNTISANASVGMNSVGNKTLFWRITLSGGGVNEDSANYYQMVNPLIFGLCNGTLTDKVMNVSFIDEITNAAVTNVTLQVTGSYWYSGSNGALTKSFSFNNATGNTFYTFCTNGNDVKTNFNYQYTGIGAIQYPTRVFHLEKEFTTSITQEVFPLLKTADGIPVVITVVNQVGQIISGAFLVVNDSTTTISSGFADGTGAISFWLSNVKSYTIYGNKTGVGNGSLSLTPALSSYYLVLGNAMIVNVTPEYNADTNAWFTPGAGILPEGITNFSFNINSPYYLVGNYNFSLFNSTALISSISGYAGTYNYTTYINNINATNGQRYSALGSWSPSIPNTTIVPVYLYSANYVVYNDTVGNEYSILHFGNDLRRYLTSGKLFGINTFSLNLIVFLIIFSITGVFSYKFGLTSPLMVSIILAITTAVFDVGLGLIAYPNNILQALHPASIIAALAVAVMYFREGTY
jgi:hypothetical protein